VFRNPEEGIIYEPYDGEYKPNSFYYQDENRNYILDSGENATEGRDYYSKNRKSLSGFKEIQVANIDSMFTISSQGKSAKEKLDELLY